MYLVNCCPYLQPEEESERRNVAGHWNIDRIDFRHAKNIFVLELFWLFCGVFLKLWFRNCAILLGYCTDSASIWPIPLSTYNRSVYVVASEHGRDVQNYKYSIG